jgi:GNAT superfamily N-acetyltransferase
MTKNSQLMASPSSSQRLTWFYGGYQMKATIEKPRGSTPGRSHTILRIGKEDHSKATKTLAVAFEQYNVMRYVFPEDQSRVQNLERLYRGCVSAAIQGGGVATTGASDPNGIPYGAVVWLNSGEFPIRFSRLILSGMILTPLRIGGTALSRLEEHEGPAEHQIAQLYPGQNMAYLWLIGTTPAGRGQGLSRTLIEYTCQEMKRSGHAVCVLKTDTEENVRLYQHLGFTVTGSGQNEKNGLGYWILERKL